MALNANDVQQLYVAYLGRAADTAGLEYWTEQVPEDFTLADLRWSLVNDQPEYQELYGDKSREELVTAIYQNMFGRDPEEAGLEYWVEGEGGTVPADELMQLFIDAASEEDRAAFDAKVEDANENPTEPTDPEEPADTDPVNFISLTAGTDRLTGTDENDKFEAYLSQNEFTGGVSNTLSSADHLDGGAGYDSLFAELTSEFRGADGGNALHTQPRTTNIEQVEIESREGENTLDAKHMYGVERIGSKQSDGSLQIDNLTTLANDGETKRNTSDLTITMDHTANTNSIGLDGASDLTVYFDDNYLIAGEQSEFSIQLRIVNNYQLAENDEPLSGFQSVTFSVGDQVVVVDITDAETYQQVADAINAELAELGINGVQADPAPARTSLFSDDVPAGAGYEQGQLAGEYLPVNIVSTTEPLTNGPIELESNIANFDGLNTWVDGDSTTTDDPISVNIELTKVGRGGIGGDLLVGAKSMAQGIEEFNVTVMGEDHLPNNLGTLSTTASGLSTVNIASEAGLESHASLEIRSGFGQASLELVDASAFLGDLTLGSSLNIFNLDTLIATGGGDVDYNGTSFGGHDTSITTGAGNDTINVDLVGVSNSGSTPSSAVINAGDGNNEVVVESFGAGAHTAIITTGSGDDVIRGNGVSVTVNAGAGNDAIYAENTGDRAVVTLLAGEFDDGAPVVGDNVAASQLLYGREIQVTLAIPGTDDADGFDTGFESTVTIEASNGYLTTERDLYEAAARAINEDPVLSKLASASVDSNGHLTVQYLVDGLATLDQDLVQIEVLGEWSDLNSTQRSNVLNAVRTQAQDSSITETVLETAYNAAAGTEVITADGIAAESHTFEVDVTGLNVNEEFIFSIDGEDTPLHPNGDLDTLNDQSITIGGETYDIAVDGETLTLTAVNTGAVDGTAPALTVTGVDADGDAATVDGDFTNGVTGVDVGSNSTTDGSNVINAGTGNDVIVLSSNDETTDIVVFDAGEFGTNTIVHFTAGEGEGADVLDFSAWLNNQTSASGSVESRQDIAVTLNTGDISANEVTVVEYAGAFAVGTSFDAMTDAQVLSALNANYDVATTTDLVGNTQNSLLMIQNMANEGEYNVYQVTSSNTAGSDFTGATLVGTVDFGENLTGSFADANFA